MAARRRTPSWTDLTAEPWALWPPLRPLAKRGGRPRAVARRAGITPLRERNRTGCQGERLPHALLPQRPVDAEGAPWRHDGTGQYLRAARRADVHRQPAPAPAPTPRAASLDSPSVQRPARGGARGEDGGTPIPGCQRQVGGEPVGRLVGVVVDTGGIMRARPPPVKRCAASAPCTGGSGDANPSPGYPPCRDREAA